ncbi:hypothetical protein CCR75_007484 [Bremia lactucae]|uniref:Uncharacterized protein n=1 Tax=Bremia lactucae TaxID=4779 RepID=A0A976ICM2_BRELC|nr:hypothetical protein CCR75_007484 [Bremia lactucae]
MEAPTATRRVESAPRAGSLSSARMLEAQREFQGVVKQELQLLLTSGIRREEAVKLLLRRIVASLDPPDAIAVRDVVRQFQMNHEDAVRALIVKQELGRLKRQGLDSYAAIEELTRKMKQRDIEQAGDGENLEAAVEDISSKAKTSQLMDRTESDAMPAAEKASPIADKDGNETSLSLIQRIGQVSISFRNTLNKEHKLEPAEQETDEVTECTEIESLENESVEENHNTSYQSPLRVRSPNSNNLADVTPHSRKRRASFGNQCDAIINNSPTRSVQPLFPSYKKQKQCSEEGEGFVQVVARESKLTSLNKSSASTGSSGPLLISGGVPHGNLNSKNLHKRQRDMQNDESPIAEEFRVSHINHRHRGHIFSKRQKSGSTH